MTQQWGHHSIMSFLFRVWVVYYGVFFGASLKVCPSSCISSLTGGVFLRGFQHNNAVYEVVRRTADVNGCMCGPTGWTVARV